MKCEKMTFEECELAILRQAVDNAETKEGHALIRVPPPPTARRHRSRARTAPLARA